MIDQATQQKIKDTADIVDVVSDYVHLIRSGANYKGLCPFHNERTPSFSVNRARNFCYCFSCKKGGSPVNFLMQKEGISYTEALRQLAKRYGIKIEEKEFTDEERAKMEHKEALYLANEWAMEFFEKNLHDTQDGRDIGLQYLYSRGLTEEAIRAYHLGYSPDRGDALINEALKRGFNLDILKELGLVGTSQQGRDYDRFRGRVIFPIMSSSQKVVGFGGRTLKNDAAKYVNSPESEIYKKSMELYGMSQARRAIVERETCFLVEGYLDVIGMWQSGMQNVVASSGTALTDEQIGLIHRFSSNVTLIYDGDEPGIKAAFRGMNMLLDHNLNVSVLLLPDGEDPDSFSRKHTPEEFREYVEQHATDVIRFKAQILKERAGNDPQKRFTAIRSIVETLAHIPDKIKREIYIQECSKIMNVSEKAIIEETADAFAKVQEKKKREREMRRLNRDIAQNRITPQPSLPQEISSLPQESQDKPRTGSDTQTKSESLSREAQSLRPFEWKVLQYCIKYGFLDFCEAIQPEGDVESQSLPNEENGYINNEKRMLTVVEYVNEELAGDGLEFSVPAHAAIFRFLLQLLPSFRKDLADFIQSANNDFSAQREVGIREIASKNLSIMQIEREEGKLEERLNSELSERIRQFSRDYPARILASHEHDEVRNLTNEAVLERYQLSKIYSRERPVESEEDKLFNLLPLSITVWKNGILDMQFQSLMKRMNELKGKGLIDEERELQARLLELMRLRSEFAKNIGDRILCPS